MRNSSGFIVLREFYILCNVNINEIICNTMFCFNQVKGAGSI